MKRKTNKGETKGRDSRIHVEKPQNSEGNLLLLGPGKDAQQNKRALLKTSSSTREKIKRKWSINRAGILEEQVKQKGQ